MSAIAIAIIMARVTDIDLVRQARQPKTQHPSNAFDDLVPQQEKVGKGPYVLVISEVNGGMTNVSYRSGQACILARDETRRQIGGVRLQVFCVPR